MTVPREASAGVSLGATLRREGHECVALPPAPLRTFEGASIVPAGDRALLRQASAFHGFCMSRLFVFTTLSLSPRRVFLGLRGRTLSTLGMKRRCHREQTSKAAPREGGSIPPTALPPVPPPVIQWISEQRHRRVPADGRPTDAAQFLSSAPTWRDRRSRMRRRSRCTSASVSVCSKD